MNHHSSEQVPKNLIDTMDEYINLPRIVRAVQITPEFALRCMDGHIKLPERVRVYQCARIGDQIKDFVVEFTMKADQGGSGKLYASFNDWIMQGTIGEWYPVSDEVFKYKYARHYVMEADAAPYKGSAD